MSTLYALYAIIHGVMSSTTTTFNVGFYNTGQYRNLLESINDFDGTNPPQQQLAQIEEIKNEATNLELDFLCLSDLLLVQQLQQYTAALSELFPYSFSQLDVKPDSDFTKPRTACTARDFIEFNAANPNCTQPAIAKCDEILRQSDILQFQICLAQECPLNYEKILYGECIDCISIFAEANNWDPNVPGQALGNFISLN